MSRVGAYAQVIKLVSCCRCPAIPSSVETYTNLDGRNLAIAVVPKIGFGNTLTKAGVISTDPSKPWSWIKKTTTYTYQYTNTFPTAEVPASGSNTTTIESHFNKGFKATPGSTALVVEGIVNSAGTVDNASSVANFLQNTISIPWNAQTYPAYPTGAAGFPLSDGMFEAVGSVDNSHDYPATNHQALVCWSPPRRDYALSDLGNALGLLDGYTVYSYYNEIGSQNSGDTWNVANNLITSQDGTTSATWQQTVAGTFGFQVKQPYPVSNIFRSLVESFVAIQAYFYNFGVISFTGTKTVVYSDPVFYDDWAQSLLDTLDLSAIPTMSGTSLVGWKSKFFPYYDEPTSGNSFDPSTYPPPTDFLAADILGNPIDPLPSSKYTYSGYSYQRRIPYWQFYPNPPCIFPTTSGIGYVISRQNTCGVPMLLAAFRWPLFGNSLFSLGHVLGSPDSFVYAKTRGFLPNNINAIVNGQFLKSNSFLEKFSTITPQAVSTDVTANFVPAVTGSLPAKTYPSDSQLTPANYAQYLAGVSQSPNPPNATSATAYELEFDPFDPAISAVLDAPGYLVFS